MTASSVPVKFNDLALSAPILEAIAKSGYETPSPIQAQTIPVMLEGRNVLGQAQTGTGKTAAFALPILEKIDAQDRNTQVLVLVPTRELALQVCSAFKRYGAHIRDLNISAIYGGEAYGNQLRALRKGTQIVVGTPGRVMDHMRKGTLDLSRLQCLVLDEADEMLKMGFIDDVEWVLEHTPKECQMALLSATMRKEIRNIANKYIKDAVKVTIKEKTETVSSIEQSVMLVPGNQKLEAISRFVESQDYDGMIIFVKTKSASVEVSDQLKTLDVKCAALNGDVQQSKREAILKELKKGKIDIVVATDVAARGIDVERMSHVINYDLPSDRETYIHRIGRTGRAGRSGMAISFVKPNEKRWLKTIEQASKQQIDIIPMPCLKEINDKRLEQFERKIEAHLSDSDLNAFQPIIDKLLEKGETAERIAAALIKMHDEVKPIRRKESFSRSTRNDRGDSFFDRDERRGKRDRRDGRREGKRSYASGSDSNMQAYRIEVGREHGVSPKNIVGAIANEINLSSANIGQISIQKSFSTVYLPKDLPKSSIRTLKKVWVAGRAMDISIDGHAFAGKVKHKPRIKKSRKPSKSKY